MEAGIPTESSCPQAQCRGQLSFYALSDPAWMVLALEELKTVGYITIVREGRLVYLMCSACPA